MKSGNYDQGSKKVHKFLRGRLKWGEGDLALITAHAKLGVDNGGAGKRLSLPMKGMAKRTLNIHFPKTLDLPSRVKWLASNGNGWWSLPSWLRHRNNLVT